MLLTNVSKPLEAKAWKQPFGNKRECFTKGKERLQEDESFC